MQTATSRTGIRRNRFIVAAIAIFGASIAAGSALGAAGDVAYSSSLWEKKSNETTGLFQIEERDGGHVLTLSSDFKTKPAPDLKIVLSPHTPSSATARNALEGGVIIAPLTSPSGAQEYPIDPSVDLAAYDSVLIHCEQYTKLWSAAPLAEGRVIATGGDWKKKSKKTRGAFEISETPDGQVIRFADDFKTAKAPEPLRIVVSSHTVKSARNKNAMEGGQVVGLISDYKGGQSHALPDGLHISPGSTLLLHCEKYTKLWSAAPITLVEGSH